MLRLSILVGLSTHGSIVSSQTPPNNALKKDTEEPEV